MKIRDGEKHLEFPCECASARGGYSDPWAPIAQNGLLQNGTKEKILNLVAGEPRTVAQMAKGLGLSKPTILAHVVDMMRSELIRESEEYEKRNPVERYYEPNFPIITAGERAEFDALCAEMAEKLADLFEKRQPGLERAFGRTELGERGWAFSDVAQYLFARVQRSARVALERRGALPKRKQRGNGVKWLFWAEEGNESSGR